MTWTPARTTRLIELLTEGDRTARQIGELLGVSKNAVIGKSHRLGMGLGKPRRLSIGRILMVLALRDAGYSFREIGRVVNRTHATVAAYYHAWNTKREALRFKPAAPEPVLIVENQIFENRCVMEGCDNQRQRQVSSGYCARHHTEKICAPRRTRANGV